jgi:hypothetical protein
MTKQEKKRPRIGDECWFVEWCSKLAFDECGDVDRDNCKNTTRRVNTREEAEALAKEVWPRTKETSGIVEYWHARYEAYDDGDGSGPYLHHWEPTEEWPEVYEGED